MRLGALREWTPRSMLCLAALQEIGLLKQLRQLAKQGAIKQLQFCSGRAAGLPWC